MLGMKSQVSTEIAGESDRLESVSARSKADAPFERQPSCASAGGARASVGSVLPGEGIVGVLDIGELQGHRSPPSEMFWCDENLAAYDDQGELIK